MHLEEVEGGMVLTSGELHPHLFPLETVLDSHLPLGDRKEAHQVGTESPLLHPAKALRGSLGSGRWDSIAEKLAVQLGLGNNAVGCKAHGHYFPILQMY